MKTAIILAEQQKIFTKRYEEALQKETDRYFKEIEIIRSRKWFKKLFTPDSKLEYKLWREHNQIQENILKLAWIL